MTTVFTTSGKVAGWRYKGVNFMSFPSWVKQLGLQSPFVAAIAGPPEMRALLPGSCLLSGQSQPDRRPPLTGNPAPRCEEATAPLARPAAIEITPEMIEAGLDAYWNLDREADPDERIVSEIFRAMILTRR
jgi:hypothetical protein